MSAADGVLAGALQAQLGAGASAGLMLVLAERPWRGRSAEPSASAAPLALGAGTLAGFLLTRGAPAFPPAQALHWLFFAILGATALGVLATRAARAPLVAGLLLAFFQAWLLLAFQRERHWGRAEGLLATYGLTFLVFASWRALTWKAPTAAAPRELGLALALALAAGAYGLGGGALFAQLAGAFALSAGLCAGLGLWRRASGLGVGGAATLAYVHAGLAWLARWLYELSGASFALLLFVPFAPLLAWLVPRHRPRTRAALAFLAPILVAGAALARELAAAETSAYG